MTYQERIECSIRFIEENLSKKISLQEIASAAFFSEYHFHRIFHAITGENVMYYLRKRRLTEAAKSLLISDSTILKIALEYQFDSQESFTRAFKQMFGITPGKYRQNNKRYLLLYKHPITVEKLKHYKEKITMEPEIIEKGEFEIVGLKCKTSLSDNRVPALWQEFIKRWGEIKNLAKPGEAYGVCLNEMQYDYREFTDETEFTEIVGAEVTDSENIPEGMLTYTVPKSKYAVFTHKGKLDSLKNTYDYIYGVWIPASKYEVGTNCDFEFYDSRFKGIDNPDSEMFIYIPIK